MTDPTIPTQEQVIARIAARERADWLGFERSDYLSCLDFGHARPFLKDDVTAEEWDRIRMRHTRETAIDRIKGYIPFAFGKAFDERGISASRSIHHFVAWAWLAGDTAFSDEILGMFDTSYEPYGLPILRRVCAFYGVAEPTPEEADKAVSAAYARD